MRLTFLFMTPLTKLTPPNLITDATTALLVSAGSFSPPTMLHLLSLEQARDHVRFVLGKTVIGGLLSPVNDAYHKPSLISAAHRLQMCRLAVADSEWIDVDEWEAHQPRYVPTFRVLQHLHKTLQATAHPEWQRAQLYLVGGADLVAAMDDPAEWPPEHVEQLLTEGQLLALPRPAASPTQEAAFQRMLQRYPGRIHYVEQAPVVANVSATLLRQQVARGASIRYLTPRAVEDYIRQHRLYSQ
ncbi:hypothetical protein CDCA_CDCA02G0809 [Cyanidium caldarium]|uniref:Nicotinamide-nucleotide adenylyltransferase n=1 Tax=Cyanidium caldarium TaxID=2771 RepID=A0AAV9IRK9_CYACA|nr:hypothetical protein CDCA_CDCA02G0809 [Cyanidium caldarium]